MSRLSVSKSAVINAPIETVYGVLADYRLHHPRILPAQYFSDLLVEEGGTGAGTIFRLKATIMGRELRYHMAVTEPEPGRVLRETDIETGLQTTFRLTPVDGIRTRLEITTEWDSSRGLSGLVERIGTPPVMGRVYAAELQQLNVYVATLGS